MAKMPLEHRLQSLVGTWQDISWEIENALNCDDTSDIGDGEWRTAESTPEQATHWSRRNTAESEWLLGYSRIENDDLATRRLSDARSVVAPAKMTFSASEDSPTRSCHESKEATRLLSSEILTHSSPMKLEIWEAELDTLAKPKQARDWCSQNTSAFGGCDEHSRVESDYITASRSSDARKTIAAAEIVVPQQLVVLPTNSQIEPLEAELDALPELEIGAIRQPETEPMPWKAITRVRSREFSAGTTHYSVHGNVDGLSVKALPDSGADQCFISPQLAGQLGYTLDARDQRQVSLATGKKVQSPGSVMIPWKFEGEDKLHLIKSWVLPGSINNLILGSQFLNATSTLTKFTHRIKSTFGSLSKRLQLRYLGKETQGVWGFLDDEVITALPDTGSDVMLISRRYADRRGLDIDRDESCRLELELADGSTTFTHGVVKDAAWSIGNTKTEVICDFYVLDDLNVDMVLSKNYLFEMKIFQEYAEYFIDFDLEMEPDLCNIRLIGTYNDRLNALEEEYLLDSSNLNCPSAFSYGMVQKELARRDSIRDEIKRLSPIARDDARRGEIERQRRWEEKREQHRRFWAGGTRRQPVSDPPRGAGRLGLHTSAQASESQSFADSHRMEGRLVGPAVSHRAPNMNSRWRKFLRALT